MKVKELILILEEAKEEFGNIDIYNIASGELLKECSVENDGCEDYLTIN